MPRGLRIGHPAPGTYSLTAQSGTYVLSGQPANLNQSGSPGVSSSIVGGVLTLDVGLGSARIYESWPKVENNSGGSTARASRSFRFYLGSADGTWDEIDGWDSYDSGVDYPTEIRITGLASQNYVFRYAAVNAALVEGAKSAAKTIAAAVYTPPTRNYTGRHITGTATLTAGDWIVDNDFTGTLTINAANVFLNLNGKTITHSGAAHGIVINSNATNFECDGTGASILHSGSGNGRAIAWSSTTGPAGVNIYGDLDGGQPLTMNLNSNPGMIGGHTSGDTYVNTQAARLHGLQLNCNPNNSGSTDSAATAFRFIDGMKLYDFDAVVTNAGRDGVLYNPKNCDIWSFDIDLQSGFNITAWTDYDGGGFTLMHDGIIRLSGTADHSRMIHIDRESGNRIINVQLIVTASPGDISQGVSPRGTLVAGGAPWIEVARLRGSGGTSGAFYFLRGGGDEPGGAYFGSMYYHSCDIPQGIALGLYAGWTGVLETSGNTFYQQTVESGGPGGTWHSNHDTWVKAGTCITRTGLTTVTFTAFDSYTLSQVSGSQTGITIAGSVQGYNHSTETPATPVQSTTVTGVA